MERRPIIVSLASQSQDRVLAPGKVNRFYFLFVPLVLSLASCGLGGWFVVEADVLFMPGVALLGVGILLGVGYLVFETFFIGVLPARCYLRWLREKIDQRPDAIVASYEPGALFVQYIPRTNWDVSFGANAADVGLLMLDHRDRLLKYEGDAERWIIPTESILSVKLDSFTPASGIDLLNRHTVVMLRFELDEDEEVMLRPLAAHPIRWRPWTAGAREASARRLREALLHLIDPKKWPQSTDDDLQPLLPPVV